MPKHRTFGELLREARLAANMTQAELAERAGLSRPHLANLESDACEPRWGMVKRLANALKVSTETLR